MRNWIESTLFFDDKFPRLRLNYTKVYIFWFIILRYTSLKTYVCTYDQVFPWKFLEKDFQVRNWNESTCEKKFITLLILNLAYYNSNKKWLLEYLTQISTILRIFGRSSPALGQKVPVLMFCQISRQLNILLLRWCFIYYLILHSFS